MVAHTFASKTAAVGNKHQAPTHGPRQTTSPDPRAHRLKKVYTEKLAPQADHDAHRRSSFEQLQQKVREGVRVDLVLMPFGSTVTTLCTRDTDLDLAVVHPLPAAGEETVQCLKNVKTSLSDYGLLKLILARTPIVKKLRGDKMFPYNFDISCGTAGVINSYWLRQYVLQYPVFRPMAMLIKHWSKAWSLNDGSKGLLHSYMLNLMLIYFLCQERVVEYIPPVPVDLAIMKPYPPFIELPVDDALWVDIPEQLKKFFLFYSQWQPGRVVCLSASPLSGLVEASAKGWEKSALCVEDPFITDFNVARNVDGRTWAIIQARFANAAQYCEQDVHKLFWRFQLDGSDPRPKGRRQGPRGKAQHPSKMAGDGSKTPAPTPTATASPATDSTAEAGRP
eukprot:GGOE01041354.1.p1 GENE.GGOE01041354.1~~GGOE01041354.1.p1  ORF type:complete len:421 (+),score=52.93 GGOE01041354.1:86-1264(+)